MPRQDTVYEPGATGVLGATKERVGVVGLLRCVGGGHQLPRRVEHVDPHGRRCRGLAEPQLDLRDTLHRCVRRRRGLHQLEVEGAGSGGREARRRQSERGQQGEPEAGEGRLHEENSLSMNDAAGRQMAIDWPGSRRQYAVG
jgi:hypothetical protein